MIDLRNVINEKKKNPENENQNKLISNVKKILDFLISSKMVKNVSY